MCVMVQQIYVAVSAEALQRTEPLESWSLEAFECALSAKSYVGCDAGRARLRSAHVA